MGYQWFYNGEPLATPTAQAHILCISRAAQVIFSPGIRVWEEDLDTGIEPVSLA